MSQTFNLKYPIKCNGVETSTLKVRRPTIGDMLNSTQNGRSDQEAEIWLLANLSCVSPDDIKTMDLADYMRIQKGMLKMQDIGETS
ncbi:phage tail assembly protein [Endozoicomonas sp. 4G]|uniref:phage tail assembly protein n=1 Tax=Endozoicomonas sp. 4G TaxID=2872754 RepID=UPI0020788FF5|nr:phage tail assembly protein [Endozoicomonas sp. 4G]